MAQQQLQQSIPLELVRLNGKPLKRPKKITRNRTRPSPRALADAAFAYACDKIKHYAPMRRVAGMKRYATERLNYWRGFREAMFDVRRILAKPGHMPTSRRDVYHTGGRVTAKHTKRPRS